MCVKLPLGDLNPDPYPLHSTSIYTCRVTITPKVGGIIFHLDKKDIVLIIMCIYV